MDTMLTYNTNSKTGPVCGGRAVGMGYTWHLKAGGSKFCGYMPKQLIWQRWWLLWCVQTIIYSTPWWSNIDKGRG